MSTVATAMTASGGIVVDVWKRVNAKREYTKRESIRPNLRNKLKDGARQRRPSRGEFCMELLVNILILGAAVGFAYQNIQWGQVRINALSLFEQLLTSLIGLEQTQEPRDKNLRCYRSA